MKPAIGTVLLNGWCTATLITPKHVLTAAHCNLHSDTLPSGSPAFSIGGNSYPVSKIYLFGPEWPSGTGDFNVGVALLELGISVPSNVATPLWVAASPPTQGTISTMYGYGCNVRNPPSGVGTKRYFTFNFGNYTSVLCSGDSGGPAMYGYHNETAAIWGVNSYSPPTHGDVWGDVGRYKEDILSVIRMWNHGSAAGITGTESGFRRNGLTLSTHSGTAATSCRSLCIASTQCNSFRHQTSTNTCTLLKDVGDWVSDPDYTSGLSTVMRPEYAVDRPGYDYSNFWSPTYNTCSTSCANSNTCAAFTYVISSSWCWLKTYAVPAISAAGGSNVVSGVKRGYEYYTDRQGQDYIAFLMQLPNVKPDVRFCQAACSQDSTCKAYTYRNPQYAPGEPPTLLNDAKCWLKVGPPSPATNVSDPPSGFKRLISGLATSTPKV